MIVLAEATEENQNITLDQIDFGDFSFPLEIDIPITDIETVSIPSVPSTPVTPLNPSTSNQFRPTNTSTSSTPSVPTKAPTFIAIASTSSAPQSATFIDIPSPSSPPTQSNPFTTTPSKPTASSQSQTSDLIFPDISSHYLSTPAKSITPALNHSSNPTPAQIKETVSTPFKKALFWPGETSKKKKNIKKIRLPSAATSDEWKMYYKKIEDEKKRALIEKEKRKELREVRAKIKKEKEEDKKTKKIAKSKKAEVEEDFDDEDLGVAELPTKLHPLQLNHDDLKPSQWVVVPYAINEIQKLYVGQILTIDVIEQTASIKFLEKKVESEKFVWPKQDDIDAVNMKEIVRVLREPTFDRWGYLTFEDF